MEDEEEKKKKKMMEDQQIPTMNNVNDSRNRNKSKALLLFNCLLLSIGNCGGPLIMRLYFTHGGKRVWLSSCLETAGWPIIFIPLAISYCKRRRHAAADIESSRSNSKIAKLIFMRPRVLFASAFIGVLTGFDDYLYAYGVARLPVSTSALIIASQLAFTAGFAFLLVKQKFTSYTINAVVLLTMGGGILALHTSGDRPAGESTKEYVAGFLMTLAAAMLYGLVLPLIELTYNKAKQRITYTLVLEIQLVMSLFATIVCAVGMFINNDFKVIPREAKEYGLGATNYYVVIIFCAIAWQCFFLGAIGVIFCSSSLFSGIIIALLLPITEILAVIIFHENFQVEKGISLILNLWGFVSYFYGEIKNNPKLPIPITNS